MATGESSTARLVAASQAGGFAPGEDLGPWWREEDLAPPVPWSEGKLRGWVLPGYDDLSLRTIPWKDLREDPRLESWERVKRASTRLVVRGPRQETDETLYFKWARVRGWRKWLGSALRAGKTAREFHAARGALAAGFLTPTPVLYAERKVGPFLRDAYLVTRGIDPDWEPFRTVWLRLRESGRSDLANCVVDDLGRAARVFHDRGFAFADSRSQHWFARSLEWESPGATVDRDDEVLRRWAVIDLDSSELGCRIPWWRRRKLIAMIAASMPWPPWTDDDTRRLATAYAHTADGRRFDSSRIVRSAHRIHYR